jgi:hypothetical protein
MQSCALGRLKPPESTPIQVSRSKIDGDEAQAFLSMTGQEGYSSTHGSRDTKAD